MKLRILTILVMLGLLAIAFRPILAQSQPSEFDPMVEEYQNLRSQYFSDRQDTQLSSLAVEPELVSTADTAPSGACEALKTLPAINPTTAGNKTNNTDTTEARFAYDYKKNMLCGIVWSNWAGPGSEDFFGLWQVRDMHSNLIGAQSFHVVGNNPTTAGPAWDYFEWQMPFGLAKEQYHVLLEASALQMPGKVGALPSDWSRVYVTHPYFLFAPNIQQLSATCARIGTVSYIDRYSNRQSTKLVFTPAVAPVVSIGTLPYGRYVDVAMDDGQPINLLTIQYTDTAGGHYSYKPDKLGPSWGFFGTYAQDHTTFTRGPYDIPLLVLNEYSLVFEYLEGNTLCLAEIEIQWDP